MAEQCSDLNDWSIESKTPVTWQRHIGSAAPHYNAAVVRRLGLVAIVVSVLLAGGRVPRAASPLSTVPIVVELFTSEGCSSCPPADELLARLVAAEPVAGARIVALGEHVDYWDQLGWKDRFSSPALTARQELYARRLTATGAYTPQLVIDGRAECVGSDAASATRAIARAATAAHGGLAISLADGRVRVAATALPQSERERADVVVAVTEDQLRSVVTRGENHGRTLSHVAVVRQLTTIGEVVGASGTADHALTIAPDWQRDHLNVLAFVQQRHGGAVLASSTVPFVARP